MDGITVGVLDEHQIFAEGVLAVLRDDPSITEVSLFRDPLPTVDVAVLSLNAIVQQDVGCPVVACVAGHDMQSVLLHQNAVFAVLARETVTADQLCSAVHAAASGLRIQSAHHSADSLSERSVTVLQMLAAGADTREISTHLGYSERTIKEAIQQAQRSLGARSRAQAVALAMRSALI